MTPSPQGDNKITFCNLCDNFRLKRDGDNLQLICPGKEVPFLTLTGCKNPTAKRTGQDYIITCQWVKKTF